MRALRRGMAAAAAVGLGVGMVLTGTGATATATTIQAVQYTLTISPAGVEDYFGINSQGDILGDGTPPGGTDLEGLIVKAGTNTPGFLGFSLPSTASQRNGINDLGHAVGFSFDSPTHAVKWTGPNTTGTDISGAAGPDWVANATNANDDIVGEESVDAPAPQELLTTPWLLHNGAMTALPTLAAGQDAEPFAINKNGLIVGSADSDTFTRQAVSWQNGQIHSLGNLAGSTFAEAFAVNSNGVAVGESSAGGFSFSAVQFANGTATKLNVSTGISAQATGINDSGVIVGEDGDGNPFVYQNGVATDLNSLIPASSNLTASTVTGINNNGVIVGSGTLFNPDDGSFSGVGYELTPAAAPRH